jgi:4,5-dihydroxyphthalate decarboxylase
MSKLGLSIAVGDYDRVRPLVEGAVRIDGVDPVFLLLEPEEVFFRAFRHQEFDVCELSLSSFTLRTARGDNPYVGVPVFTSRAFRHTAITVRKDRIRNPLDLAGKRIGVPEWQLTACVWARALIADYGVDLRDITWVRGGIEEAGRVEKIDLKLPEGIRLEDAPGDRSLSQMLEDGDIDGIVAPRVPSCQVRGAPHIGWLFDDARAEAEAWYRSSGIFPIMHLLGVRKTLVAQHPWLPATLLKAFTRAKDIAVARLADTAAAKVTLPFVEDQVLAARKLMGEDYWPYGLAPNRRVIEAFLGHHRRQGLSSGSLNPEDLFHPTTWESSKI